MLAISDIEISMVFLFFIYDLTPKLSSVARLPARLSTFHSGHPLRALKGRHASVTCLLQRLVMLLFLLLRKYFRCSIVPNRSNYECKAKGDVFVWCTYPCFYDNHSKDAAY